MSSRIHLCWRRRLATTWGRAAATAALAIAALAIAGPCPAHSAATEPNDDRPTEIAKRLDAAITGPTLDQFWGAALVARDGEVLLAKGHGLANQDGRPIDRTSLFELASVTKPFTAMLVMRLDRAGALSIDDPISRHLPDVPADKRGITIRHLLSHTSGLGPPADRPSEDTREAAERMYLAAPLGAPPGTKYEYSNVGYMLLAAIVERATGKPFEDALREHVLAPAGMRSAGMCGERCVDRGRAVARARSSPQGASDMIADEGAVDWPYPDRWAYVGCGGVVASLDDLLAFDRALRGDVLLDAARRAALFTPGAGGYALGWQVSSGPLGRVAEHTGGVAGFRTIVRRWLDRDQLVIVLTNEHNDPIAIADRLGETLAPELVKRAEATLRPAGLVDETPWMRAVAPTAEIAVDLVDRAGADAKPRNVRLQVRDPAANEPAIVIDLTMAAAAELADELESALAAIDAAVAVDARAEAVPPVRATIHPGAYRNEPDPDVIHITGRPLLVNAIPQTMHPKPGDEHRVSIVLNDPTRSFMPVFIELGRAPATRVAQALRAAGGR